jgi:surface protein
MFYSASAFNQNIAGWNTARVSYMAGVCPLPSHTHMRAYRRLAALRAYRLVRLRLVHACARLACFGWYHAAVSRVMLRVRLADVLLGVGLQPEHRGLEHGEGFEYEWRMPWHADMRAYRRLAALGAYRLVRLRLLRRLVRDVAVWLTDIVCGVGLQPEHRRLEHGERYEHVLRMPLAVACARAGISAFGGASGLEACALAADACLRSAGMLRLVSRCFGAGCVMCCGCGSQMFSSMPAFNQNIAGWNTACASDMTYVCPCRRTQT